MWGQTKTKKLEIILDWQVRITFNKFKITKGRSVGIWGEEMESLEKSEHTVLGVETRVTKSNPEKREEK